MLYRKDPQNIQELAAEVERQQMNYRNFDSRQFDSRHSYNGISQENRPSVLNYSNNGMPYAGSQGVVIPRGLSTYSFRIIYDNQGQPEEPVTIQLFRNYFNSGSFVGNDLVFTNSNGNTATIQGLTTPFIAIQRRSETGPFSVAFMRLRPQDEDTFMIPIEFTLNSTFGFNSENNLTPDDFFTPEQFQLKRVDVPVFFNVNGERGMVTQIMPTETGRGYRWTLFVDQILDTAQMLNNEPPVSVLDNPNGLMQSSPSQSLQEQINRLNKG